MSQLDLGLAANVSARHISFLETERARPSRGMVMRLCEELEVPRGARNDVLTAAGLAPAYGSRPRTEAELRPVLTAVTWMLERHAPYPAFSVDRHWRLMEMNDPAAWLLGAVGLKAGDSLVEALLESDALGAALVNRDDVLRHGLARLRTEAAQYGGDPILAEYIERLSDQIGAEGAADLGLLPAIVPTIYRVGGATWSLFSTIAQFGTAEDVALSELKIECMFPADTATETALLSLAST